MARASRFKFKAIEAYDYDDTTVDSEIVPSSLASVGPILRVANEVEKDDRRVAYLCRKHAFEKASSMDPQSVGSGVIQFKTSLLRKLEKEHTIYEVETYLPYSITDSILIQRYYQDYYEENIKKGQYTKKPEKMAKIYQTAAILYDVLSAQIPASEVKPEIQRYAKDVEEKKEQYERYNILPLYAVGDKPAIMELPQIKAALRSIRNVDSLLLLRKPEDSNKAVNDILEWLSLIFGFQKGNVANQREHLVLLLANISTRAKGFQESKEVCIGLLNDHTIPHLMRTLFMNYSSWCDHLQCTSNLKFGSIVDWQQMSLLYIGLYLLIWGEASNIRFMPECICYIFHNMAKELNSILFNVESASGSTYQAKAIGEESFLQTVVVPIYEVICKEAERNKGGRASHSSWRNYDDLNEYFWSDKCFNLEWPMNLNSDFFVRSDPKEETHVTLEKRKSKINFVEVRTFLHLYRSFDRMWMFLILVFQAMLIISWHGDGSIFGIFDNGVFESILSIFITSAVLNFFQASIDIILSFNAWRSLKSTQILRYLLKFTVSVFWVVILPIAYSRSVYYYLVASYLTPNALSALRFLFPPLRRCMERSDWRLVVFLMWWAQPELYVGRGMHENMVTLMKYTLYWMLLLISKFTFSYYMEILPLVAPTKIIMELSLSTYDVHEVIPNGTHHNIGVVIAMWAPIVMVYFMDVQIWYAIFSTIIGGISGAFNLLGEVNRKAIHKLLGIPTGGQKFSSIGKLPILSEAITEWRARYPGPMVPPTKMVKMIDDSDGEDSFDFRMDFLMCFVAVLVDCHKQSCLREEILEYLDEEMEFATIDWCDLVVEKLRTCKDTWNRQDPQSFFVGPLAILMLLYVDSVECTGMEVDSAVCPLAFWNLKRLRERERLEILAGGFGTGRFKGLTRPRNYNVEQWATKEERLTILRQLIYVTKKNKVKIEGMLDSLLVESHEDEEVQELKSTFDSLFEKKDSEREDQDDAVDLASHKINSVLDDLRNDEKNHINEGENAGDGIDDDLSDGSPIMSLYRKSLVRQNKKISKSRLKAVGSSVIDFDDQEADVQVQSFANDGVEDHDEQIEDGGKSVEVRRSARLENLKHVRETEEMFVTPKRRKRSMQIGGQGTESDKERECNGELETVMSARVRRSPRLNLLKGASETKASFVTPNCQKSKTKILRGETDGGDESGLIKTKKQLEERELRVSELGKNTIEVGEGDKSVNDAGNSSREDCSVGGDEKNKGAGGVYENDAEEVHKPLGLMRAIMRIKAAEVHGAHDYRGPDSQFVTRAERRVDTDNKVAAKPNDEQNTNLKADDVKKDEIYEAKFVCDQRMDKMVEMEAKDSKHDEQSGKEDPKIEIEVKNAPSDGRKEESGGIVFSAAGGAVDDKDEHGVPDGEENGAVDETDRVLNSAEGKSEHDGMRATIINMQGCTSAVVDSIVSGDGGEREHDVDAKGKAAEEVPFAENDDNVPEPVFDERNLDGPNWSLGMTQIGAQVDVSHEIGCTSGKMEDIPRTETKPFGDVEATADLSMVIMVDPVSSYDPAIAIHKGQTGLGSCGSDMYEVEDNIPLANRVRMLAELGAQKRKLPFREKVAAEPNRSPYYIRTVDMGQPITKKETNLWDYIHADESPMHLLSGFCRRKRAMEANMREQGSSSVADVDSPIHMSVELLFRSPTHVQASRSMFKSLNVGNEVSDGIIDCWAEVLNFQEKRKSREAYSRQFFGTKVVFPWMLTTDEGGVEARMHKFRLGIKGAVNRVDCVPDFRNQDIVFFPILEHKHFYLVVFELRDPGIYVIDNDKARQGQLIEDSVYYLHKDTAYKIKDMFVQYLREVGNPRADDIEYCNIQRMPVPWATTANTTDCGVFLMRHMECYMGKNQSFNCGFSTSGARKMAEVRKLRKRYAAHILCSEVNVLLPKIKEECRIE